MYQSTWRGLFESVSAGLREFGAVKCFLRIPVVIFIHSFNSDDLAKAQSYQCVTINYTDLYLVVKKDTPMFLHMLLSCDSIKHSTERETAASQVCDPCALLDRGEVGQVQRHRIDRILDNFFISRISLRFLVDTFVCSKSNKPGFSGVIQSECSPVLVSRMRQDATTPCCNFNILGSRS